LDFFFVDSSFLAMAFPPAACVASLPGPGLQRPSFVLSKYIGDAELVNRSTLVFGEKGLVQDACLVIDLVNERVRHLELFPEGLTNPRAGREARQAFLLYFVTARHARVCDRLVSWGKRR
jgi:hypothetical protein